jgi:hypothetical protein
LLAQSLPLYCPFTFVQDKPPVGGKQRLHPMPDRVVDLAEGVAMVVTDLHGDWPLYTRYRDVFLEMYARGLIDHLIFTGDLIHSEGAEAEDRSLDIVLDLIDLKTELGPALIVLLGNHEMPHIYHVPIAKGDHVYTPRFERAMGHHRERILGFFRQRPFVVRTAAGVTVCHAGAFPEAMDAEAVASLLGFSHARLLAKVEEQVPQAQRPALRRAVEEMTNTPYAELARTTMGVDSPDDPRYDDYLLGIFAGYQDEFKLLWAALFSRNEYDGGMKAYTKQVSALLAQLSKPAKTQRVMVTGHIGARNGYRILARGQHLRIASGAHAHPYASARYLLFDAGETIARAEDLLPGLVSVFAEA